VICGAVRYGVNDAFIYAGRGPRQQPM